MHLFFTYWYAILFSQTASFFHLVFLHLNDRDELQIDCAEFFLVMCLAVTLIRSVGGFATESSL